MMFVGKFDLGLQNLCVNSEQWRPNFVKNQCATRWKEGVRETNLVGIEKGP